MKLAAPSEWTLDEKSSASLRRSRKFKVCAVQWSVWRAGLLRRVIVLSTPGMARSVTVQYIVICAARCGVHQLQRSHLHSTNWALHVSRAMQESLSQPAVDAGRCRFPASPRLLRSHSKCEPRPRAEGLATGSSRRAQECLVVGTESFCHMQPQLSARLAEDLPACLLLLSPNSCWPGRGTRKIGRGAPRIQGCSWRFRPRVRCQRRGATRNNKPCSCADEDNAEQRETHYTKTASSTRDDGAEIVPRGWDERLKPSVIRALYVGLISQCWSSDKLICQAFYYRD